MTMPKTNETMAMIMISVILVFFKSIVTGFLS